MPVVTCSPRSARAGVQGVADHPTHAGRCKVLTDEISDTPAHATHIKPGPLAPGQVEASTARPGHGDPGADRAADAAADAEADREPSAEADRCTVTTFRADLPAPQVDAALRRAVKELQCAERNVVLWFSEMNRRGLFRELGYASIHQYASEALGFSSNRIYRFLHLAAELERLPRLRASLATGEIGWTKARELVKVASASTEERWIAAARRSGRRDLEQKVQQARLRAAAQRKADPAQGELAAAAADPSASTTAPTAQDDPLIDDAPVSVVFRLTPLQLAQYEAQMECVRKTRLLESDATREEILLAALDQLVASARRTLDVGQCGGPESPAGAGPDDAPSAGVGEAAPSGSSKASATRPDTAAPSGARDVPTGRHTPQAIGPDARLLPRGNNAPHYRIVIYRCALCNKTTVQTQRGPKKIVPGEFAAIECDAIIQQAGERNKATIPPAIRQRVLSRDHHRCRAPGCRNTHYLEVHHIRPRERGGSNRPENLVTLCSSCHRLWHERGLDGLPLARTAAKT